jgi:large conductance mechanosensitive channel
MLKEFRKFLEQFNVIPVAVGLVLALAFTPVVDSVVKLIMSIVGRVIGLEPDDKGVYTFADWTPGGFPVGDVVNAGISFVLIAFVVFLIVKGLAKAGARTEAAAAGPSDEVVLLTEIRDQLRSGR